MTALMDWHLFRIFYLFQQDGGVGLRHVIQAEAFRGLGFDGDGLGVQVSRSASRSRISPAIGVIFGWASTSVASTFTMR